MKIIYLLASLGSGGAERVVSLLANRMCEDGHNIQIVCLKYNDVYYTLHDKIKVVAATEHASNRIMELFWLRKYIQKEKPDVVIPFTEGYIVLRFWLYWVLEFPLLLLSGWIQQPCLCLGSF